MKKLISLFLAAFLISCTTVICLTGASAKDDDFIKYAEFNVTYPALKKAMELDINSQQEDVRLDWIEILSYLGAKYGGDFTHYNDKDINEIADKLKNGESIESLTNNMKYYPYYHEVYTAVLGGMLGEYTEYSENGGSVISEKKYGLKAYSPIAKTFPYSHYDDFGASRTYGYNRNHLGHDMMCAVGTPIICVEDGIVECMGWNQYGGWRIGIRSLDKKRYYYYAHLRQNRPYQCDIHEGMKVSAGEVIGYAGRTGYSTQENVNNIETPHLHWGVELIFDESQKECDNEIWIDLYALTQLLEEHKSETVRVAETKEYYAIFQKALNQS
ncbi:MAG: M23 family metallopeptidase [Clostridia bacterium]|nr:M23 family metallopeptidase [Clostridia bacterium]MBR2176738.1 M23 family metallopeptidase [Clostridia bacterium]